MAKAKVQQWQAPQRFVVVDTEATKGATIGTNLYWPGGAVVTEAELRQAATAPAPSVGRTMWSLLLQIPANVTALQNASGAGLFVVTGAGTGALRSMADSDTIGWTNPGGVAGDPSADFIGTAADIPYDNATSGLASTDVQGAVDEVSQAANISIADAGGYFTGTDVEAALQELGAGGGGGSSGQPDASSEYYFREDFGRAIAIISGFTIVTNEYAPICYCSGSGAAAMGTPASNAPGVVTLNTGGTSASLLRLVPVGFQLVPGGGVMTIKCRFRVPTLSNGTQDFLTLFGLFDAISGTTNNLIDCLYNHATNSGQYQLRTRSGGTTTTTNAAVGPAANTWTTVEIQINAAANSVSLLVDGVSVATNTTNIPTTAMTMAFWLNKNAGATARTVDVDYMEARIAFPSGR